MNRLQAKLPEGLLVDGAWLERHRVSRQLRSYYVDAGWLEQPARGVYVRPRGSLKWQQVVISLQTLLLNHYGPLYVGGHTALELQGHAHYLSPHMRQVHLYGPEPPPSWLFTLPVDVRFVYHRDKLFESDVKSRGLSSLAWDITRDVGRDLMEFRGGDATTFAWGQWDWPLTLSTPERAVLELLDELPSRESFDEVDHIVEGLVNLRPARLQKLLEDCRSVKVKRLFFFFADRHRHAWSKRLDKSAVDLGSGKRALVAGGRLDPTYNITVPESLYGGE